MIADINTSGTGQWDINLICCYHKKMIKFLGTLDFNEFLTLIVQKMSEKDIKSELLKAFKFVCLFKFVSYKVF